MLSCVSCSDVIDSSVFIYKFHLAAEKTKNDLQNLASG